jgi:glycosyltransferase involved in cell wall biosynthesis
MRIGIATVQVPFIRGGAENLVSGLARALREAGHDVEVITMPFRFFPVAEVSRSMDIWESENFESVNGYTMDAVICVKFPTFYLQHPNKKVWLLHQHRAVFELWDAGFSDDLQSSTEGQALRKDIFERDKTALASCKGVHTISKRVSARLLHYSGISSTPIYHPPQLADQIYSAPAEPYIFFPSRLETLKRQSLLIEAMTHVRSPVVAVIAGGGGQLSMLQGLIAKLGIANRVRLTGPISHEDMTMYYAYCLGVFFGPYDEDYGYVTLEAMLAAKPVITCTDSGGPLEFVVDQETGFITPPQPQAIAEAIDQLYAEKRGAARMGEAGLERYRNMNLSWTNVVECLV